MVKFSANLGFFLILIGIAVLLTIVGELSGEFGQIRQLSSEPQNVKNIKRGEFASLNNGAFFGFDVDSEGNDFLKVMVASNQTFSWHETIGNGTRIFRSENFTLDATVYSFETDIGVKFYNKQTCKSLTIQSQRANPFSLKLCRLNGLKSFLCD